MFRKIKDEFKKKLLRGWGVALAQKFFFLAVLGFELRPSHLLGRVSRTICPGLDNQGPPSQILSG
jgi:hypothetical protein